MKWGKVKWLIIVCLLAVDCFLFIQLFRSYAGKSILDRETLKNLSEILEEDGISIAADVIPQEIVSEYVYCFDCSEEMYREAFSLLTGSSVTGTYLLPDGNGTSMVFANGDMVRYYQNLYLYYNRGGSMAYETLADAYFENPDAYEPVTGVKAAAAQRTAKTMLSSFTGEQATIGSTHLKPSEKGVYAAEEEGIYLAVFEETIGRGSAGNDAVIHSTEVCVVVKDGEVVHFSGIWIPFLPTEVSSTKKLDQPDILFSEKKRLTAQEETTVGYTITSMERTYYRLWDEKGTLYLRPAWSFLYSAAASAADGMQVICDAVTGEAVLRSER